MTATTRDRQRADALCKLLTKPMRATDIVRHFGQDERYRYAVHNLVARGVVVNLNPKRKSPGLFVLASHAPKGQVPERAEKTARRRPGRPAGSGNGVSVYLDFRTGALLQAVWMQGRAMEVQAS